MELDPNDPDLKLPDGATLAEPKVLDIKSVVEDQSGDERREDTNTNVTVALQAEVLCGPDSAKISAQARARISVIANEIKTQNATRIRVFGFTDNLGSSAHGDVLSRKRANAVHGILEQEMSLLSRTVAVNATAATKALAAKTYEGHDMWDAYQIGRQLLAQADEVKHRREDA